MTRAMEAAAASYDYIVVGAGSAGAIVATRLTEDPNTSVLLLEAGPEDDSYWSKIPIGFAKILFQPRYMWTQQSEPEPELRGRRIGLSHGKVLGGSSSINGLVFVRGMEIDYRHWVERGASGWGFDDVLPYFRKAETWAGGPDALHGGDGPISVENARWNTPLADAFIAATSEALGVPRNDDFNGPSREVAGYWPLNTRRGRRSSTAEAYLKPNRSRPNLHVVTEALVTRVEFEGRQAVGVVYERAGQGIRARARREIVLSAGALQTPQLLQLSGVGPANELAKFGIPVVHELKGVGEGLMDHVQAGRIFETDSPDTFNIRAGNPFAQLLAGINYYLGARDSVLTIGAAQAGAFLRTRPDVEEPDIQLHFLPFKQGDKGYDLAKGSGFRLGLYPNRIESRGHVRLTSTDVRDAPAVSFKHLSDHRDVQVLMDGMKLARRIAQARPLQAMGVREIAPGPVGDTDAGLLDYIRDTAETAFHYSGTARMGQDDLAVVDPNLRVRGVGRLRVIDASIMPAVVSGNTNAATVMIGEKGADLVRAG